METTTGIKPVSSGLQPDDLSFAHAVMEKGRGIEPPLSGLRDQRTASMCYPSMAERGGIEPQAVTLNLFSKQLQTQSTSLSIGAGRRIRTLTSRLRRPLCYPLHHTSVIFMVVPKGFDPSSLG